MTESEILHNWLRAALIDAWSKPDDDYNYLEPYKCYCSCEECREWERKTGQKPDCEYSTEED